MLISYSSKVKRPQTDKNNDSFQVLLRLRIISGWINFCYTPLRIVLIVKIIFFDANIFRLIQEAPSKMMKMVLKMPYKTYLISSNWAMIVKVPFRPSIYGHPSTIKPWESQWDFKTEAVSWFNCRFFFGFWSLSSESELQICSILYVLDIFALLLSDVATRC